MARHLGVCTEEDEACWQAKLRLTVSPAPCPALMAASGPLLPVADNKTQSTVSTSQSVPTPIPVTTISQPQVLATHCTQAPTFCSAPAQVLAPTLQTALLTDPTTAEPAPAALLTQPSRTPVLASRQIAPTPISAAELWGSSGALPARQVHRQVSLPVTSSPVPLPAVLQTQSAQAPARVLTKDLAPQPQKLAAVILERLSAHRQSQAMPAGQRLPQAAVARRSLFRLANCRTAATHFPKQQHLPSWQVPFPCHRLRNRTCEHEQEYHQSQDIEVVPSLMAKCFSA